MVRPSPVIPKILHQTWKDAEVPARWRPLQETWKRHHPRWRHRLWTDFDNRELVRRHYPWFLPVYDGYREPIRRVDAARYFLLHHLGGVYVDLDFEALKPIDPLLDGHGLVLGHEPSEHLGLPKPRARGLDGVVGNAFLASRPGHPFWAHLCRRLVETRDAEDTLDATGPFLVTRTLAELADPGDLYLAPAELLYPIGEPALASGAAGSRAEIRERAGDAFAVHHWSGSWWRGGAG